MKSWAFCFGIVLLSCSSSKDRGNTPISKHDSTISASVVKINESTNTAAAPLSLESFTDIPKSIKGCSAIYAQDMDALQQKEYVFVADLKEKAYIKVADRFIALKLSNTIDEGSISKEIYKGAGYTVQVVTHKVKKTDTEVWLYTGQILIIKDDQQESVPIVGEVGC